MSHEWLYVISNPSMPGIYKVGVSSDPEQRLQQLRSTGTPGYFSLEYLVGTTQSRRLEAGLHGALGRHRTVRDNGPGREWFKIPLSELIQLIDRQCGSDPYVTWRGAFSEWKNLGAEQLRQRQRDAQAAIDEQNRKAADRQRTESRSAAAAVASLGTEWLAVSQRIDAHLSQCPRLTVDEWYYFKRGGLATIVGAVITSFVEVPNPVGFFIFIGFPAGVWISGVFVEKTFTNAEAYSKWGGLLQGMREELSRLGKSIDSQLHQAKSLDVRQGLRSIQGGFHAGEVKQIVDNARNALR